MYESKEFGQFFMCPNCLEFIEEDICLECGEIYDVSIESEELHNIWEEGMIIKIQVLTLYKGVIAFINVLLSCFPS